MPRTCSPSSSPFASHHAAERARRSAVERGGEPDRRRQRGRLVPEPDAGRPVGLPQRRDPEPGDTVVVAGLARAAGERWADHRNDRSRGRVAVAVRALGAAVDHAHLLGERHQADELAELARAERAAAARGSRRIAAVGIGPRVASRHGEQQYQPDRVPARARPLVTLHHPVLLCGYRSARGDPRRRLQGAATYTFEACPTAMHLMMFDVAARGREYGVSCRCRSRPFRGLRYANNQSEDCRLRSCAGALACALDGARRVDDGPGHPSTSRLREPATHAEDRRSRHRPNTVFHDLVTSRSLGTLISGVRMPDTRPPRSRQRRAGSCDLERRHARSAAGRPVVPLCRTTRCSTDRTREAVTALVCRDAARPPGLPFSAQRVRLRAATTRCVMARSIIRNDGIIR